MPFKSKKFFFLTVQQRNISLNIESKKPFSDGCIKKYYVAIFMIALIVDSTFNL